MSKTTLDRVLPVGTIPSFVVIPRYLSRRLRLIAESIKGYQRLRHPGTRTSSARHRIHLRCHPHQNCRTYAADQDWWGKNATHNHRAHNKLIGGFSVVSVVSVVLIALGREGRVSFLLETSE